MDPSLYRPSNGDCIGQRINTASDPAYQPTSRRQTSHYHPLNHHALNHHKDIPHQYISRATNSDMSFLPLQFPAQSGESGADGQTVEPFPQNPQKRRANSGSGFQVHNKQAQPPEKKRRRYHAVGNTAADSAVTGEIQEIPELAKSDEELDGTPGSDHSARRIRWTDGVMEWLDEKNSQWKAAGYHRDYRAELITLAAQQPGAPVWTEDMGTDYTSYSPLTRDWTEDPNSVIDSKGRRVFEMKERPADWERHPRYTPLIYNGLVMLDHKDRPIRDIPGLPLTLETQAPASLLGGLRRCAKMTFPDFMARFPATRETATGTRKLQGATAFPQRVSRWLEENGIKQWLERPKSRKNKQQTAAKLDSHGAEAVPRDSLPSAGQQLGFDHLSGGQFNRETLVSPGFSYEPPSTFDPVQSGTGPYPIDNEYSPLSSWETSILTKPNRQSANYSNIPEFPHYLGEHSATPPMSREEHQQHNQAYPFGSQSSFPPPTNILPSNVAYSPNVAPKSTIGYTGSQKQPQSYGGQTHSNSVIANTNGFFNPSSMNTGTQNGLFPGGDFCYIVPNTAAEIAFVKSALDYTRAEYRSLMSAEPPESSYLASYAQQYLEIQTHLELMWPFSDSPPVKLRAIGPIFGGSDLW